MVTDRPPRRKSLLEEFVRSERMVSLALPDNGRLTPLARTIEEAMKSEKRAVVSRTCGEFLGAAAEYYRVPAPEVRVLASRPLRVHESGWSTELFGDYDPDKNLTRVWMRTAVRKQVTSFGTFLSTLCHEFCHQLDFQLFGFSDSPHTRGFYERAAVLYHHARGTPKKELVWARLPEGRFRIDWVRMRAGPLVPIETVRTDSKKLGLGEGYANHLLNRGLAKTVAVRRYAPVLEATHHSYVRPTGTAGYA